MTAPSLQHALNLQKSGSFREAAAIYADILRIDPRNFDALYLLGFLNLQQGQFSEAERLLSDALRIKPDFPDALYNRGSALLKLGRDEEALTCFNELLALHPQIAEAHLGRGSAFNQLRYFHEALESFEHALAINPYFVEAWYMRGVTLSELGRWEDALLSYERCLAIKPASVNAQHKRADILFLLNRHKEANDAYINLLAIAPMTPYVPGRIAFDKLHCCDWDGFDKYRDSILAQQQKGARVLSPSENMAIAETPNDQLQCARLWVANECPPSQIQLWRGERYTHDRLRVAYLSNDFRFHPVAAQLVDVIERHDKSKFEIIGISFGHEDKGELHTRLVPAFETFINVEHLSDFEVASLLVKLEVDIAVDLMGFTGGCRSGILALRPAPVQVNYLGFPGTMGADHIDYIIADRTIISESDQSFYTECVAYLPYTYMATDSKRRVADVTPTRSEAGLPAAGFVFCSFNNSFKYSPATFDIWMRLVRSVENSVLWLPKPNVSAIGNLCREGEARGVASERLVFAPFVPNSAEHLARLRLADLFLDTNPYNAHSSASDALWCGVPLVTCSGKTFASRVAASLLTAIGMPELITHSLVEYEALALKLASDPIFLTKIKDRLTRNREVYPLFDTGSFTRAIEAAYKIMWQRSQSGLQPKSFAVEGV